MGVQGELNATYMILVGTATIFLLVLSIVVFFYLYQKKLHRKEQELITVTLRYQEELLYANWAAVEEERKRFSRELHDDIGSTFSTLSLMLSTMSDRVASPDRHTVLVQSQQLIDNGIKGMRRILHDIVPPDIDIFGLSNAVLALCERINHSNQIHIAFHEKDVPMSLFADKQKELVLYRIIQELINNTMKHAGADKAELELAFADNVLSMDYRDNGIGLGKAEPGKQGLGLRNIQSRAKMIHAECSFDITVAQGMRFSLKLPVNALAL